MPRGRDNVVEYPGALRVSSMDKKSAPRRRRTQWAFLLRRRAASRANSACEFQLLPTRSPVNGTSLLLAGLPLEGGGWGGGGWELGVGQDGAREDGGENGGEQYGKEEVGVRLAEDCGKEDVEIEVVDVKVIELRSEFG